MTVFSERDYPFRVGNTVSHIKHREKTGKIINIDRTFRHPTSCTVEVYDKELGRTILEQWWTDRMVLLSNDYVKTLDMLDRPIV